MSSKLDTFFNRGSISALQRRGGQIWAEDWLNGYRSLVTGQAFERKPGRSGPADGGDVMRAAARRRFGQMEQALGGRESPWCQICHRIILGDQDACEVAEGLGMRPTSVMDILRAALDQMAAFYDVRVAA